MNCNAFVKIGFSFFFFLRIYLTTSHRYHIFTITNLILNKNKQSWNEIKYFTKLSFDQSQTSPRGSVLKIVCFLSPIKRRNLIALIKIPRRGARQFAKLNVVNSYHFFMCWIWWYRSEHLLWPWNNFVLWTCGKYKNQDTTLNVSIFAVYKATS